MAEVQALTLNSALPQAQFTSPSQKFGLVAKGKNAREREMPPRRMTWARRSTGNRFRG